jgi:hypothetical protein
MTSTRRVPFALAYALLAAGPAGCSGMVGSALPSPEAGASSDEGVSDTGAAGLACAHYYAAEYTRCGGPVLPAAEQARQQARFVQVCLDDIALPGSGMTAATVEACASALDLSSCELPGGPPVACNFAGSLAGGAPCNEGFQCQSGRCQGTEVISPEGPVAPTTCGTCAPSVQNGQVCAQGNFSAGCSSAAICMIGPGMATAAEPQYTCVPITQGSAGASCDDLSRTCQTGLYCDARTGQCKELGGMGAPCGEGATPPGNPGGCKPPLSCIGEPGVASCGLGAAGAFCLVDYDCAPGLGCLPGPPASSAPTPGTCQPVTWVAAGQACDGYATRCLVGSCGGSGWWLPVSTADGGPATGTCPSITEDGQPCNSACDAFAECFSATGTAGSAGLVGSCTLLDSAVCGGGAP